MILLKPSVDILKQNDYTIVSSLKNAEKCGHLCRYESYKNVINDVSYKAYLLPFFKDGKVAFLNHAVVYLIIPIGSPIYDSQYIMKHDIITSLNNKPLTKIEKSENYNRVADAPKEWKKFISENGPSTIYYITTTYAVLTTTWLNPATTLAEVVDPYIVNNPVDEHEKAITVRWVVSLGMAMHLLGNDQGIFTSVEDFKVKDLPNPFDMPFIIKSKFTHILKESNYKVWNGKWIDDSNNAPSNILYSPKENDGYDPINLWLSGLNNVCITLSYMQGNNVVADEDIMEGVLPLDTAVTVIQTGLSKNWLSFLPQNKFADRMTEIITKSIKNV